MIRVLAMLIQWLIANNTLSILSVIEILKLNYFLYLPGMLVSYLSKHKFKKRVFHLQFVNSHPKFENQLLHIDPGPCCFFFTTDLEIYIGGNLSICKLLTVQ